MLNYLKLWNERRKENIDVYYITENANWAVYEVAKDIVYNFKKIKGKIVTKTKFIKKESFIHYGSLNVFLGDKSLKKRKGKKVIVTCFHIVDSDPRKLQITEKDGFVEKWHTSCEITKNKLVELGVSEEKIRIIPIGVDNKNYAPLVSSEKALKKKTMEIKEDAIVIGYFQKDGNGWGEGETPKLIKGPDIFCNVIEKIAKEYKIHVLLSGPARGYVKKRLKRANIPYSHYEFEEAKKVSDLYKVIDVYMVTSREEGGPRAILESMASGVPIISTKVGQAPDIIKNEENGILVEVEDENALIHAFKKVVTDEKLRMKLIKNGMETAKKYDVKELAGQYEDMLYQ